MCSSLYIYFRPVVVCPSFTFTVFICCAVIGVSLKSLYIKRGKVSARMYVRPY